MSLLPHIVICGRSLYLDAIAATLRSVSHLLVTQLHERAGMVEWVVALAPDALIVECDTVDEAVLATLSTLLPDAPVLEVHTLRSVLTIHGAQEIPMCGVDHLAQMLEAVVPLTKLPHSCHETQTLGVGL